MVYVGEAVCMDIDAGWTGEHIIAQIHLLFSNYFLISMKSENKKSIVLEIKAIEKLWQAFYKKQDWYVKDKCVNTR